MLINIGEATEKLSLSVFAPRKWVRDSRNPFVRPRSSTPFDEQSFAERMADHSSIPEYEGSVD